MYESDKLIRTPEEEIREEGCQNIEDKTHSNTFTTGKKITRART